MGIGLGVDTVRERKGYKRRGGVPDLAGQVFCTKGGRASTGHLVGRGELSGGEGEGGEGVGGGSSGEWVGGKGTEGGEDASTGARGARLAVVVGAALDG